MISPDITISNHRLRWAVDGMRFTAPLHTWQENLVEPTTKAQNKQKEVLHLCRWSTHTPRCRDAFFRFTSGKGYYPFPEAEMASKYREESSAELILKLTSPRQEMPPCNGLGPTMCV